MFIAARIRNSCFHALWVSIATVPVFAAPAAPEVVVRKTDVKQLRFDWNYVPRANYYELWFRANDGAAPAKFAELPSYRPRVTNRVSIHLLDWQQARYWVSACNPGGCTASTPLSVATALRNAVGEQKSTFPLDEAHFGAVVALSEDGSTLVAAAPDEANDRNKQYPFAALYVYARVGAGWHFEARLAPVPAQIDDGRDLQLAIDADGGRFIVGMPNYAPNSSATEGFGQALIYERTSAGWRLAQRISAAVGEDRVGQVADIDAAGNTALVGNYESGGALRIYRRDASGWTASGSIAGPGGSTTCTRARLSADGQVVARGCLAAVNGAIEVFAGTGWARRNRIVVTAPGADYDFSGFTLDASGDTIATAFARSGDASGSRAAVSVFHRASGEYSREASLAPGAWFANTRTYEAQFGSALSLSADGKFLAVGHPADDGVGDGVLTPPLAAGGPAFGAVYLFERRASWSLRRIVKPDHFPGPYENVATFGAAVALAENGRTLIIGQPGESAYQGNPGNHQDDPTGNGSGALWIY